MQEVFRAIGRPSQSTATVILTHRRVGLRQGTRGARRAALQLVFGQKTLHRHQYGGDSKESAGVRAFGQERGAFTVP